MEKKGLTLSIPRHHQHEDYIRREPNLKIQYRQSTPTHIDGKNFLHARPSTPSTSKQILFDGQITLETACKQNLKARMNLEIEQSHLGLSTSKSATIRREQNLKILQRQNTPACCEAEESFKSFEKNLCISSLAQQKQREDLSLAGEKGKTQKKKLVKSLTLDIISVEESFETDDKLRRTKSENYIRRERNMKLVHRQPTPITCQHKNILDTHVNKHLTLDIEKLYDENSSYSKNCFIRREKNLKIFHRQDTPALLNDVFNAKQFEY